MRVTLNTHIAKLENSRNDFWWLGYMPTLRILLLIDRVQNSHSDRWPVYVLGTLQNIFGASMNIKLNKGKSRCESCPPRPSSSIHFPPVSSYHLDLLTFLDTTTTSNNLREDGTLVATILNSLRIDLLSHGKGFGPKLLSQPRVGSRAGHFFG